MDSNHIEYEKDALSKTHNFTVDEVQRMYEHGILPENERLELIDGQLYVMSPKNPPHVITQRKLMSFFSSQIDSKKYFLDREIPLDISQQTMPEPDFLIVNQRPELWQNEHVKASDVVLLVEVADSTLERDLGLKKELYAQAGIPHYWVISLQKSQIHVFSNWQDGQYQTTTIYRKGPIPVHPFNIKITFGDIFPE